MRIVQVGKYFPPFPGGMENSLAQLSLALSQRPGLSVTCVVSNDQPRRVEEQVGDVQVTRLARYGQLASTPLTFGLREAVRRAQPDLVHVHLPNPLVSLALLDCRWPIVVTYHCDVMRYPRLLRLYKPVLDLFLRRADRIIATSDALLENSPHLEPHKDKCSVIRLPVPVGHLAVTPERAARAESIREQYGQRIVLFVGRLVHYKGLHHLIPAFRGIEGARLLVIGSGPERARLEALIKEEHLEDRVSLLGYLPDEELGAYYQAASVVALTSIDASEALGLTLVEALAAGKPMLTTRLETGVKEMSVDGVTGVQVEVGDVAAMARALNDLLRDDDRRSRLGAAAREHYRREFDERRILRAHLDIYEDVQTKACAAMHGSSATNQHSGC